MQNCFHGMVELDAFDQHLSQSREPKQLQIFRHTDLTYCLFFHFPSSLWKPLLALGSPSNLPRYPVSACTPTCGSNSPIPLAALHDIRERNKYFVVILCLISVHLSRGTGWRNEINLLTGSHIAFLAKVLKTETAHVHDTSLKPSGFYGCRRFCFQGAS